MKVVPDDTNGLEKISTVDTLQLRGVDIQRFVHKIDCISSLTMKSIVAAVAAVIEY